MEIRDFSLKIKSVEDSGRFDGLASTYGDPPDLTGDVIASGAFSQAIKSQGAGYPLLMAHKQDAVLGIARIEDSPAGLVAHGELDMTDPVAQSAFAKIKMRALRGLSIGFLPAAGKVTYTDTGRILHEVRLFEISLTPVPANQGAQVFSVKSIGDARLLLQRLSAEDIAPDVLAELRQMGAELKRLTRGADSEAGGEAIMRELVALAAELKTTAATLPRA